MPDPRTASRRQRLVVARTVFATRHEGDWIVGEAHSGARLPAAPLVVACLDACAAPSTRAGIRRRLHQWPPMVVDRLVTALVAAGVLVDARAQEADSWAPWDATAEWYHHATRDVPVRKGTHATEPPPSPVRRRQGTSVRLPWPQALDVPLLTALAGRRTWRRFGRAPLSLDDLGTLLGLTFGVQSWADAPGAGRTALKTSPSGGARHSLEAYVCVRRVHGLPAGLYHYRPDSHRLVRLREGCSAEDIGRFLPGQPGYRSAAVTCVMSSELARVRWRYPHARAYRVVLIEAGHLAQTFALVATALGLASFTTGALAETAIEDALDLSASTSPVLYACGAGARPAGVDWAPYADADPPPRRLTPLGRLVSGGGRRSG